VTILVTVVVPRVDPPSWVHLDDAEEHPY
jgi:hypothetical protein